MFGKILLKKEGKMSRSYMMRIDGELKNHFCKDDLYAIIHRFVPRSQQWHFWFHADNGFTVICEVCANGGSNILDNLNNLFKEKLNNESIIDWEINVFDLHPDNCFGTIKKDEIDKYK